MFVSFVIVQKCYGGGESILPEHWLEERQVQKCIFPVFIILLLKFVFCPGTRR